MNCRIVIYIKLEIFFNCMREEVVYGGYIIDPRYRREHVDKLVCGHIFPFRIPVIDNLPFSSLCNLISNSLEEINKASDLSVRVSGINQSGPGIRYEERVFNVDISGRYSLIITLIQHDDGSTQPNGGKTFWGDIRFEEKDFKFDGELIIYRTDGEKLDLSSEIYKIFLGPENRLGAEFLSFN